MELTDRAEAVVDRAERWLRKHGREKFFLWLHFIDPHAPYREQGSSESKSFRGDTLLNAGVVSTGLGDLRIARLRAGEVRLATAERQALVELYEAEVRTADMQLARLLMILDELKLERDTVVAMVSDHGEEFWEHGGVEHGHQLYEEVLRVPFILRGPGIPAGRRVADTVRTVDALPTILDVLGVRSLASTDGVSLVERFHTPGGPLVAVSENLLFSEELRSITTDEIKYIRAANGIEEMFERATDPLERTNLVGCRDVEAARSALVFEDQTAEVPPSPGGGDASNESPVLMRRLKALGYVQ